MRGAALFFLCACAAEPRGEAAAPAEAPTPAAAADPPAPAGAELRAPLDLNLAALAPEGGGEDPYKRRYRLADGRLLAYDGMNDRAAVIDGAGQRHDLGAALLVAVPGLGRLVVPKDGPPWRYCDVAPGGVALRTLWTAPESEGSASLLTEVAGAWRGAPLLALTHVEVSAAGDGLPGRELRLVRLLGPGQVEARTLARSSGLRVAGPDAVRGDRLLLLGPSAQGPAKDGPWSAPLTAPVYVAALTGAEPRPLGLARGDWTMDTAVPHPYVTVRWSDGGDHPRGWSGPCVNLVGVADEKLTPCEPGP